ncbi:MAG TPA: hypothetical protein VNQ99_12335 [Xanthobacteraceae bacterium]|nr:hypothetical protein [Xanthobacteraceae bacterium]
MAKRKLKRSQITLAGPNGPKVYERLANHLPWRAEVEAVEVDDPMEKGGKLLVYRNLRDDPLARLRRQKQIEEAQFLAGRKWQRAYEISELSGSKAIDTTRDVVDGGQIARSDEMTDLRTFAFEDLAVARAAIGSGGDNLMRDFLGAGMGLAQMATKYGRPGKIGAEYFGCVVRQYLHCLAVAYRFLGSEAREMSSDEIRKRDSDNQQRQRLGL